jgi:transposase
MTATKNLNKTVEEKLRNAPIMVTVKELASRHKIDAKRLRQMLRDAGIKPKAGRYAWKEGEASLSKIADLLKSCG